MNQRYMLSAIATVGVVAAGASAQDAVQWRMEDGGNGHWYQAMRLKSRLDHAGASAFAHARGAQLFSGCGAEFDAAVSLTQALSSDYWILEATSEWTGPWIGLRLEGTEWIWVDSSACAFDRWDASLNQPDSPGLPGESVAHFYSFGSGPAAVVHDVTVSRTSGSLILEWSADCNNDGIVDYGQIRAGALEDLNGNGIPDCCDIGDPCEPPSAAVQWRVQDGGNGHWYAVIQTSGMSWDAARAEGAAMGGYLVVLQSAEEDAFVRTLTPDETATGFWIGASREPDSECSGQAPWMWVDGSSWEYTAWASTQPDCWASGQNRVAVVRGSYLPGWHDFDDVAIDIARAVIEWSADCNNDGIVDYGQILSGELEDLDGNGVPDCCTAGSSCAPCAADLDRNGAVDGIDLAVILNNWGTNGGKDYPNADIDGDGTIGGSDLAQVLGNWGLCP